MLVGREQVRSGIYALRGAIERRADQKDCRSIGARDGVETSKRSAALALLRRGCAGNENRWSRRRKSGIEEFLRKAGQVMAGHIDDQSSVFAGETFLV